MTCQPATRYPSGCLRTWCFDSTSDVAAALTAPACSVSTHLSVSSAAGICARSTGRTLIEVRRVRWVCGLDQDSGARCDGCVGAPLPVDPDRLPVACGLGPEDGRIRMRRWRALSEVGRPTASQGAGVLEVRYQPGPGVHAELVALAAAEQECCSFVCWTVAEDAGHSVLRVVANPGSPDDISAISSLFGVG